MREHHSAGTLVVIDGRVLVLRRIDRAEWIFPKGHLEPGETPEQAARRETTEETGLEVRIIAPLGATEYAFRHRSRLHHKQVDWFLAAPVAGAVRLEPLFAEWRMEDEASALALLTHEEDRITAVRAFAVLQAGVTA